MSNSINAIEFLIKEGVSLDEKDKFKRTPLEIAEQFNS